MSQIYAGCLHEFLGVEEYVVIARPFFIGRITDVIQFCEVNRFGCIHDSVSIVVILTGSVFVVVVPLSKDKPRVIV